MIASDYAAIRRRQGELTAATASPALPAESAMNYFIGKGIVLIRRERRANGGTFRVMETARQVQDIVRFLEARDAFNSIDAALRRS